MSAFALSDADDRAVVTTVLEHFANRRDAHFYDASAILVIIADTDKTRGTDSDYQYLNQGEGNCAIPQPLYLSLRKRNSTPASAAQLAGKSSLWRFVTSKEAETISPAFPPPPGRERELMKTLVTLTKPGYSADERSAFVNLSFLWSIHGAEAQYLLRRVGSSWEVACSHLVFYV
jgi:hypothetical protein